MDVTTLAYALLMVLGLVVSDIAMHPRDVILDARVAPGSDKLGVNAELMMNILRQEVERVSATPTVMTKPVIQVGPHRGIGMSIAESVKMSAVAYAVQTQLGYRPDEIRVTLFYEKDTPKALVSGLGHQLVAPFGQVITMHPDEMMVPFLQRASTIGIAHIDPYVTALSDLQGIVTDFDLKRSRAIVDFALGMATSAPDSLERALLENLRGLLALFAGDARSARDWFRRAEDSCPDNTIADAVTALNSAFADLRNAEGVEAEKTTLRLLRDKRPTDPVLLGTAFMTLAAARMATGDKTGADAAIQEAIVVNPQSSSAYVLWADMLRDRGDDAGAAAKERQARIVSDKFENYSEIAALYFRLTWRADQPLARNLHRNPGTMRLEARPIYGIR